MEVEGHNANNVNVEVNYIKEARTHSKSYLNMKLDTNLKVNNEVVKLNVLK